MSDAAARARRDPPPLPQPPRRPGAGAERRRDPRRGRAGARRAGPRRDDDRAAHAPQAREGRARATSTSCAATSGRSAWRASRSSATSIATTRSACRRSWRCSTSSIRRRACRSPSSTRATSPTCAPAPSPRSVRAQLARKDSKVLGHIGARGTAYWNVRLLHSIFAFDEIRVHSRRRKAATRSRRACAPTCPGANDRRHRRLGVVRARRRHRRRGIAARKARSRC